MRLSDERYEAARLAAVAGRTCADCAFLAPVTDRWPGVLLHQSYDPMGSPWNLYACTGPDGYHPKASLERWEVLNRICCSWFSERHADRPGMAADLRAMAAERECDGRRRDHGCFDVSEGACRACRERFRAQAENLRRIARRVEERRLATG